MSKNRAMKLQWLTLCVSGLMLAALVAPAIAWTVALPIDDPSGSPSSSYNALFWFYLTDTPAPWSAYCISDPADSIIIDGPDSTRDCEYVIGLANMATREVTSAKFIPSAGRNGGGDELRFHGLTPTVAKNATVHGRSK